MKVQLVVPGEPVPNARARRGRGGHWYTPEETRAYRERVQSAWMVEGRPRLGPAPLALSVRFFCARKPSHLRRDGTPRAGAPVHPPFDLDNFLKGPLDALQGLLFDNDSQVVVIENVQKLYAANGDEPRTELEVRTL